jgi:hypothetical protein
VLDFLEGPLEGLRCQRFFSIEVWTMRGLVTHYVLFVISLSDRMVHIAGITVRPDERGCFGWLAISLMRTALALKRYLIVDRDTTYSERFKTLSLFQPAGRN